MIALKSFAVLGLGNVGLTAIRLLDSMGLNSVGIDINEERVAEASSLGLDARVGGVKEVVSSFEPGDTVLLTALPSRIAYAVVERLASLGYSVVDVSFFAEPPWELHKAAVRGGGWVVVDAGVSPGLSNLLVSMLAGRGARRIEVFVGGVSVDRRAPLGWSATWSVGDLLEEYLRPARMVVDGKVVSVDPLDPDVWGRRVVEGLGEMEYFPSDGLRTLLETMGGLDLLVEYTLRWPGHLAAVKALRDLGFMEEEPRHGCCAPLRGVLERAIGEACSGYRDVVVLEVVSRDLGVGYRSVVWGGPVFSGMGLATAGFQVAAASAMAVAGRVGPGLVPPEGLSDLGLSGEVLGRLGRLGVEVVEFRAS